MRIENGHDCIQYLVIDFDSTFVKLEALDNLADIALNGNPEKERILEELKGITQLGMEGKITFPESLSRRLKMFQATKKHLDKLIERLKKNISCSIEANREFFRRSSKNVFIISGGFVDYIYPIAREFGISKDHILANEFRYDNKGNIVGINQKNLLAQDKGKVKAVESLELKGKILVIGDGFTDFEIKQAGCADVFAAFTENVTRDVAVEHADIVLMGFGEAIQLIADKR